VPRGVGSPLRGSWCHLAEDLAEFVPTVVGFGPTGVYETPVLFLAIQAFFDLPTVAWRREEDEEEYRGREGVRRSCPTARTQTVCGLLFIPRWGGRGWWVVKQPQFYLVPLRHTESRRQGHEKDSKKYNHNI